MISRLASELSGPGSSHCVCFNSWKALYYQCIKCVLVNLMPIGNPVMD